ncbi:MAG: hypothetical protein QOE31_3233 [Solirubrobacteraceae bacterium]|jgi:uncharacterized protein YkwD|nr:hypothetical protein [Solirubrobacteraceae bacterium]
MAAFRRRLPVPAFAAVLAASFVIAAPSAHAADCPGADTMPTSAPPIVAKGATLCLLNNERITHGLVAFASQPQLETAAANYSQAMVAQRFFSHVSPAGQALAQRLSAYISGVETWDIGENLAWGEDSLATPRAVVNGWMHSEGHRANILNATFREIGIGIAPGTPGGSSPQSSATFTTEFGSRVVPGDDPDAAGSGPVAGAAVKSASVSSPNAPAGRSATKKVSAAKKRWIKATCAREARRAKSKSSARKAYAARCVSKRLKAAAGR